MHTNKFIAAVAICAITLPMVHAEEKAPSSDKIPPAIAVSSLPQNIQLIVGMTDVENYTQRLKAIHDLGTELPIDQVETLIGFLRVPFDAQSEPHLNNLEYNALKNELFIALMQQREKYSLGRPLIEMFQDPQIDATWRDYCIQFIGQWYFLEPQTDVRTQMLETLYQALDERNTSIAGTAITAIAIIHEKSQIGTEKLTDATITLLESADTNDLTLISALDVGRQLKIQEALLLAREILNNAAAKDKVLVMAALATVGDLGNRSDLIKLQEFAKSYDSRYRIPANRSIRKLKAKNDLTSHI